MLFYFVPECVDAELIFQVCVHCVHVLVSPILAQGLASNVRDCPSLYFIFERIFSVLHNCCAAESLPVLLL